MLIYQLQIKSIIDQALKQNGCVRKTNDIKYRCPKCNHAKQKLEINIDSGEYHCWVCHFRGSSIYSLLSNTNNETYLAELKKIHEENPKSLKNWDDIKNKITTNDQNKLLLPKGFQSLSDVNKKSQKWKSIFDYAIKRNFDKYDIVKHNMGYVEWGEFEDRLIVPSYDKDGNLNFYSARNINDVKFQKYLNSNVPSSEIVGFELFVDFKQPINLVEGAFDAITLSNNSIPLFGKNLSKLLIKRIIQNDTPEIRIILDDDAQREAYKIAIKLQEIGKKVKVVNLNGKDPNSIGRKNTMELIENTKILTFSDVMVYKMKYPSKF